MAGDKHHFEPSVDRSRELRNAFGRFGTGVTVITAQTPNGPLGMTANSFSSVSLDPPLVLWSPAKNSQRHDPFVQAAHFCIHVLAADQLELAHHFATNGSDFAAYECDPGPGGAPTLTGCLAEFHCDTHAVHSAGDHSIVIGLIRDVVHRETQTPALLFERGCFGRFSALT